MKEKSAISLVISVTLFAAIGLSALGYYWSSEPEPFNVIDEAVSEAEHLKRPVVVGTATTATVIHEVNVLMEKRGGYLGNDMMPPGIWMDDIPHWEYGVLLQVRDLVRAMYERISRLPSQSAEDENLTIAGSRFNISPDSWVMPDSQAEYLVGIDHLRNFLRRLSDTKDPGAQFYANTDNLIYWLTMVEARLGSLSQRLSASVGQKRLYTEVAADMVGQQPATGEDDFAAKTPWGEIDDIFYEARGTSWALIHLLQAVEIDFAEVLKSHNTQVNIAQIVRELEATQAPLFSPMVLNGSGFGLWANHSLVMASYISRACAGVTALREKMERVSATAPAAQEGFSPSPVQ